jgi:endonuclease-8
MSGKWRIYNRDENEDGLATPPPRVKDKKNSKLKEKKLKDVRFDTRTRLTIITSDKVLVEFNGPILQFSTENPVLAEPIRFLGPDALAENFDSIEVLKRLRNKDKNNHLLLVDALLDQRIVSGIGNKYKSEILFSSKLYPFKKISELSKNDISSLVEKIPIVLNFGYKNNGKTRHISSNQKNSWNSGHWVFRRVGKECFICGTKIKSEKKNSKRITFWCPKCQK